MNPEWKFKASCRQHIKLFDEMDHPASLMIPTRDADAVGQAKKICFSCPVRTQCLKSAMNEEAYLGGRERHGIRGGLTARDRILIAAQDPMCARCTVNKVAGWQHPSHIKRLCRSCQQLLLARPEEKYLPK